jgi:glucose 1-dehydrogenase
MGTLDNKIAIITGGTRGLGLEIAKAYIREGASVVVASRSQKAVETALESLNAMGGRASGLPCDVADLGQVQALVDHAVQAFGRFDVWVNNAAISAPYGPTISIDPQQFNLVLQTNILGVYYGSLAAMRHFLPRRAGKLINILGRGDRQPTPLQNAYASSKSWVRAFTLALAAEYKDSGVGVYAFNPGMMDTDLLTNVEAVAGYENRLKVMPTIQRMWSQPPDIPAQRAVWLASSATDARTGLELHTLNRARLISGALREGLNRLLRRQGRPIEVNVQTVPAAWEESK